MDIPSWMERQAAIAPQAGKAPPSDFGSDFAEAVGAQRGLSSGMNFQDAMVQGLQSRKSLQDPLFELKKLGLQTEIASRAAHTADQYRAMKLKDDQITDEQADSNVITAAMPAIGTDPQKQLAFWSNFVPKSNKYRLVQHQAIYGTSKLMQQDVFLKRYGTLPPDSQSAVDEAMKLAGGDPNDESVRNVLQEELTKVSTPRPITINLNDGTEVQGWQDPKTGKVTQYHPSIGRDAANTKYPEPVVQDIAGRPFLFYRNFAPKPLDRLDMQQQEQVKINSAALRQARIAIGKATDDASRQAAQDEYDRQLGIFNDYFSQIAAAKNIAPANAPATIVAPAKVRKYNPQTQSFEP